MPITRFAPSPTGLLHLGHAASALFAETTAGPGGTMLLRLEDIDRTRCRPEFAAAIERDLAWLGLEWPRPVRVQSQHLPAYRRVLDRLAEAGLTYPCFCSRGDHESPAIDAPHGVPVRYPGTCRRLDDAVRAERIAAGDLYALRLDSAVAIARAGPLVWRDLDRGEQTCRADLLGDVVLGRKDIGTSYHLAVTWDDAEQGVEIVTRGLDLFEATHIHRLLQALLHLPVPVWRHHALLLDPSGRRYAKRDRALTLEALRAAGRTPEEIRSLARLPTDQPIGVGRR